MSALLFILFIAAFVAIQGMLYKKYIFSNLIISRSFDSKGVFPGDKVAYELRVENRKLLPLTWLSIDERMNVGLEFENSSRVAKQNDELYMHNCMLSVLPYQKVMRRYSLIAQKRGYYQLRHLSLLSTNMLGTQEYSAEKDVYACIAVYPRIRELKGALMPANTTQGDYSIRRWIIEDPMVITGVRDYSGNDSLKSINWKATAKNQKLLVNKYDFTADKRIMLILNIEKQEHSLMKTDMAAIEAAIEVCASLAHMLQEEGIPVGFATNAHVIGPVDANVMDPDTGEKHLYSIFEILSKVTYFKKLRSRELLKLLIKDFSWGTEVIVITPELSQELIENLQSLGNTKITVITLKESEMRLPSNIGVYYYRQEGEHYEAT
jgi:uncharacterized protein (DUF58 family)